jgi:predicted dehydrogenase/threonine dehydrogenase-like Zn-dependent dehydrogenase
MKQLLQNLRTGDTYIADVPVPTPKPKTALVRTAASLVSAGTERMVVEFAEKSLVGKARSRPDLVRQVLDKARREGVLGTVEAAFNRLDQPMPLGYSSAGTIVAVGDGLEGFHVGQRVACAGGGYAVHAEYTLVPQNLLTPLPDHVDFESAAVTTLGAIALHGFRLADTQLGERVAVIGIGMLGLLAMSISIAAGCHVLGIDLDKNRVEFAQKILTAMPVPGIGEAISRDQAEEAAIGFTAGRGFDAVLICADTSSNDPVELAGTIARDRAHIVAVGAVGLEIPRKIYFEKELSFINSRSYGPGRYDPSYEDKSQDYPIGYVRWTEGRNLEACVEMLAAGQLDVEPLISHRFPIETAPQAYELITGKRDEPFLGVLLTYFEKEEVQTQEIKEAVPPHVSPGEKKSDLVKLGVLGAGNFASAVMLPALRKQTRLELVGIASASGLNAQHAADKFGFRYATSDADRIITDPEINTIAVLTRHNLHAEQVIAAIHAGKHVFCEKPLALTSDQLDEIIITLGKSGNNSAPGGLLTVGFNRRFAPLAQRMKSFIAQRKEPLVAHYRVNAGYIPLTHWTHDLDIGGGRIIGEGCHFVDFLTYLVGQSPVSVTAHALPDMEYYREDNVHLTFSFPDGSLGSLSYLSNGDKSFPKERVEVFVGGRVAVLDDFRSLEMIRSGRRQVQRSRLRQDKGHRAEWDAFINAIQDGGPPPIPYEQLFGVTRATFAGMTALRDGVKVDVKAPLAEE